MFWGKFDRVDVTIRIWTNIDSFGGSRLDDLDICTKSNIDVTNLILSGVTKEASKCSEKGSTYGMRVLKGGFEEMVSTNGRSKKTEDCIDTYIRYE